MELLNLGAAAAGVYVPLSLWFLEKRQLARLEESYPDYLEYYRFLPSSIQDPIMFFENGYASRINDVVVNRTQQDPTTRGFLVNLADSPYTHGMSEGQNRQIEFKAEVDEKGTSVVDLCPYGYGIGSNRKVGEYLSFTKGSFGVGLTYNNEPYTKVVDSFGLLSDRYHAPVLIYPDQVKARIMLAVAGAAVAGLAAVLDQNLIRNVFLGQAAGSLVHAISFAVGNYKTWREIEDSLNNQ